jgi:hypothetical protein
VGERGVEQEADLEASREEGVGRDLSGAQGLSIY